MYDYFYGAEAEQFFFYRIPKVLFTEERFRSVSAEAKVLYGLLLDRMSLSCKNGWLDKEGRVYIIFTIEEVMTALGCADQKAGKLLHELESKCRLIERKRQGLGKPNLIYVKNFVDKAADIRIGVLTRMCLMCSPPVVRNSVFSATRTVDGFTSMPIIFVLAPSMPIISTCRVIMVDSAKDMALTVSIRPTVR